MSYQALKRQFGLDDGYLEDLKVEIIKVHQLAADQNGAMLVWTGGLTTGPEPAKAQERAPFSESSPLLRQVYDTGASD